MIWIYLYDEDERDVKTARRQLKNHEIPESAAQVHVNRLDLFDAIAASPEVVVALVDLQSDNRTDNNYSGHRVIETIRRHPKLAMRCQPIAYTVHARTDIIDLARRHGARALISKHDLDVPRADIPKVNLAGFLADQRRRQPALYGEDAALEDDFPVFPDTRRARERLERQDKQVRAALDSVLQGTPKILSRPYFWQVVRYLADDIDSTSVAHWIHADFRVPTRTVENDIEDLRRYLGPRYLIRGAAWGKFARDLLNAAPQKRLAPTDLEMVRVLQRISVLEDVLHNPRTRSESYLDATALEAIDRVVDPMAGIGRRLGHAGDWQHTNDLLKRLAAVEPDENARMILQVDFVRAVSNMYDTYLAGQSRR
jgi:hypothetical protein